MKVIIAGCRRLCDPIVTAELVRRTMRESFPDCTEVVSGGAFGVDEIGEAWAEANSVPVKKFKAAWDEYGKSAGPIRNRQMAEYADALLAVWDGKSPGTKNMIHEATKRGLVVLVVTV